MWIVYLIQNTTTKQIYIGRTNNLKRRLNEHNHGRQKATKRKTGEWLLIYAEVYRNKQDSVRRESRLKNHGRAKQELVRRIEQSLIV